MSKKSRVALVIAIAVPVLGCPLAACLMTLFHVLPMPERDLLFETRCGSDALVVERVYDLNRLAGELSGDHLEASFGGVELTVDGRAFPSLFTWGRPEYVSRGEGDEALHFFMGGTDIDAVALERCVEANAAPLLTALDRGYPRRVALAPFTGRRRVYWPSATPDDLEPSFTDGPRTVELLRDGRLNLRTTYANGGTGTAVEGRVTDDGQIDCCTLLLDRADLDSMVDEEGMTLPQRLVTRNSSEW